MDELHNEPYVFIISCIIAILIVIGFSCKYGDNIQKYLHEIDKIEITEIQNRSRHCLSVQSSQKIC